MKKKYQLGVIGAGARGECFARQLYAGHPRADLFGICDLDTDRLDKFCHYCQFDNVRRFTQPEAFLSDPAMDGVIICTPEFTHAEVACAAMRAGKAVYIEKPLAHTLDDGLRILRTQRETGVTAYVGFNRRAAPAHQKAHDLVHAGKLGQMLYAGGLEILTPAHGAAYMRRFHRKSAQSGGLLNHKSCHDLDLILWIMGHEHKVTRVSSFGGCDVLTPDKQPAPRCRDCPAPTYEVCPYKAVPGFHFPIDGAEPLYHNGDPDVYGEDNCVYAPDKDIIDNQVVIFEWEHGARATFALQMFQTPGRQELLFLGEKGTLELRHGLRVAFTENGESGEYKFAPRSGGHGGTDPSMIGRFARAMDDGQTTDSGLEQGLAATVVALKADQARLTGRVVDIEPEWYG